MNTIQVTNHIPRMRTIHTAAIECSIPERFLRRLVKENRIVYVKSGVKTLVNIDKLIDYLNSGEQGATV